jgi:hypothetical protein
METPVREKLETLGVSDSPDSVFQLTYFERQHDDPPSSWTRDKTTEDEDDKDLESLRLYLQDRGIECDPMPASDDELLSSLDCLIEWLNCSKTATDRPDSTPEPSKSSTKTSEPITDALMSEPIFDAWLLCLDDSRLNEKQTYRGSAELPKPLKIAKARCKLSFGRHHGRPPDHNKVSKYAAYALEAPLCGCISVTSFLTLVYQYNVLGSLPPTNLRNAGIRAAQQLPPSSATAWRQMTTIELLAVKTSILDAFKTIIGSIPRPHQNNPPFGSIFSSSLADSGVCLNICRSDYDGMHVPGA